jgi:hypothetical protein
MPLQTSHVSPLGFLLHSHPHLKFSTQHRHRFFWRAVVTSCACLYLPSFGWVCSLLQAISTKVAKLNLVPASTATCTTLWSSCGCCSECRPLMRLKKQSQSAVLFLCFIVRRCRLTLFCLYWGRRVTVVVNDARNMALLTTNSGGGPGELNAFFFVHHTSQPTAHTFRHF